MVHARVTRPYSHSLSDDEKLYKTTAERAEEASRDPVAKFPAWLISEGILDRHALELMTHEIEVEIQETTERALKAAPPAKGSALRYLYSERVDPAFGERAGLAFHALPKSFQPAQQSHRVTRRRVRPGVPARRLLLGT